MTSTDSTVRASHDGQPAPTPSGYSLADRYTADTGRVFASGSQALARLPFAQLRIDRRNGRNTAAFASGYPGSPLANYDRDVAAAARLATEQGYTMISQPGLNEELAASSVMGTQLAATLDSFRYDGVIGVWYGKAPGLDRASDAIRHAMFSGTSANGGVVALVGDDPSAKSSTLPSSSDATMIDLNMPMLFPGDVQEALELGHHGVALSRASGLWAGLKIVESVADGNGTIDLDELAERVANPLLPSVEWNGRPFVPHPTGRLLTPTTLEVEREFREIRLEVAKRYGILNKLNVIEVRGPSDWIGITACGHTYRETRAALALLGLGTDDELRAAGVRLLRLGMPMPLDPDQVREFAEGLAEVIVVEEKNPSLERWVKDALYHQAQRPIVHGKDDPDGRPQFARGGSLVADLIAPKLRARLLARLAPERLRPLREQRRTLIHVEGERLPYFCSGCPHNTSTQVPDNALVGAGIGCHSMALLMEPERVGHIVGVGAMGTEGTQWIGISPFVSDEHIFQNLGDGTLFHSGSLAIRAASASGVNITYKILYNGAVAMTGGQNAFGQMDVPSLCANLLTEGVKRIIVTTDDVGRYDGVTMPDGVQVWGRSRIIEAQTELAAVPGCTVLIHDQRCAAEKRRERKRVAASRATYRVLINERVCEGCGDCGDKSNCLSVQPIDTPYGRKTAIDQHSCNFDYSCMNGDCPAFATVTIHDRDSTGPTGPRLAPPGGLPEPATTSRDDTTLRFSGIGGTGVITVSQILGTAAMLDGFTVRGLDQTGLSQKAGPVVSDLRITRGPAAQSNRATRGSVDVLLAFDQMVAGSELQIDASARDRTVVIANTAETPTGPMVVHTDRPFPSDAVRERVDQGTAAQLRVDATPLAHALLGDDTMVNVFLTGVAAQAGHLPVHAASIEQAISLNGVAVDKNLAAFRWGRAWVVDRAATEAAAGITAAAEHAPETVDQLIDRLADDLVGFQSRSTAKAFRETLAPVQAIGNDPLTQAAARALHKLTAYKDEYEVARLLLAPEARAQAKRIGGPDTTLRWHLHPPMLRDHGLKHKIKLGPSARPMLRALRASKRLRGTVIDPFGRHPVRRLEREMIPEYTEALGRLVVALGDAPSADRLAEAAAIAALPDRVRGYEQLKIERATAYRAELARRLEAFEGSPPATDGALRA